MRAIPSKMAFAVCMSRHAMSLRGQIVLCRRYYSSKNAHGHEIDSGPPTSHTLVEHPQVMKASL